MPAPDPLAKPAQIGERSLSPDDGVHGAGFAARGDHRGGASSRAGDSGFHIHMLIATGLGVFLTVLLGTGLMSLVFLSNSSGHDASAATASKPVTEEEEPK